MQIQFEINVQAAQHHVLLHDILRANFGQDNYRNGQHAATVFQTADDKGGSIIRAYIVQLSLIRGIASLAILFVHTSAVFLEFAEDTWLQLFNQLSRIGTPLFAVIASFLLCYKFTRDPFRPWPFYKSRVSKIFIPYAIFTWIYLAYYATAALKHFSSPSFAEYIDALLWGRAAAHLYFINAIFQFYFLFPLFLWLMNKLRAYPFRSLVVITNAFTIFLSLRYYGWYSSELLAPLYYNYYSNAFFWIPYFALGYYSAIYWDAWLRDSLRYRWGLSLIGIIVFTAIWMEFTFSETRELLVSARPLMYIYIPFVFCFFAIWTTLLHTYFSRASSVLEFYSRYSFGVYLIHGIAIHATFTYFMNYIPAGNLAIQYAIFFLIVAASSFVTVYLVSLLPFGQYIVDGAKTRRP